MLGLSFRLGVVEEGGTAVVDPQPGPVFVGRERELSELSRALQASAAGRGSLVLIGGEPGIGKSRLADQLMSHARDQGVRVLIGRCWDGPGAPAYWPWVQVVRAIIRSTDPAALRRQLGAGASDVAQMVPDLRGAFGDLAPAPVPESESARFQLFDSAAMVSACEPGTIGAPLMHLPYAP